MPRLIKNFEKLATTVLREQALTIAEAGLIAINTPNVINSLVQYDRMKDELVVATSRLDLRQFARVIIVGFGKVAFDAVESLQNILGARIACGFVIDIKAGNLGSHIVCKVGTHPLPTIVNAEATAELVTLLSGLGESDLVICVVGGGGSSLLCQPLSISVETESLMIKTLIRSGANIGEINTVRKHISKVKGGQLAKICYPATMVNLIFSDVPGDDISMVASGPTVVDKTTVEDAKQILVKYDLLDICKLPSCQLVETPKEFKYFEKVNNILAVSAATALSAMKSKASDLGFDINIIDQSFQGEARVLGKKFAMSFKIGQCFLAAGESTVKVTGRGVGGRNQEMALAAVPYLKEGAVFIALASDGHDNSSVAGAIVDSRTLIHAKQLNLDSEQYLSENNSYQFFQDTGDYIDTGITGSNISDLVIGVA